MTPVKSSCLVLVGGEWFLSFSLGPKRLSAQSNGIDSLRELTTEASRLNPSFGVSDLFQVSLGAVAAGHSNAQGHDPGGKRLELSQRLSLSLPQTLLRRPGCLYGLFYFPGPNDEFRRLRDWTLTRMFRRPVKSFTGRSKFDRFSPRDLRKLLGLKTVSRRRRVCWPGSLRERRPDISASCFSGRGSSAGRRRERPAPLLLCGIFHPCHRRKA